jgi:ParB family chromosome partitioning protein
MSKTLMEMSALHRISVFGRPALSKLAEILKAKATAIKTDGEQIVLIPLAELHPPEFHPFHVNDDEAMRRLADSVRKNGIREPGIARPKKSGGYELLCGNRRKRACELSGMTSMPIIIRKLDDDDAVLTMIDSNLEHREKLLLSEKAWAYRIKMEALNHKGKRGDMHSVDVIVAQTGESRNQIFRIIRLTELIVTLLDKVDNRQIAFNPAVELSYLTVREQAAVAESMGKFETKPSLSQAQRMKKMSQDGMLSAGMIDNILSEIKKPEPTKPDKTNRYRKYFPASYSAKQIDIIITSLLKNWQTEQSSA